MFISVSVNLRETNIRFAEDAAPDKSFGPRPIHGQPDDYPRRY
jgi:hypothetical protein